MNGRAWTHEEDACLRREYRRLGSRGVAAQLDRTRRSIYMRVNTLGLNAHPKFLDDATIERELRRRHPQGWSDAEITQHLATKHGVLVNRHRVGILRRRLGLPNNAFSEHRRRRVAEKTRQQIAAAGVKSLAEVRSQAYREFARRSGWPEYLRPRQVQMLNVIYEQGPQTRRQLAAAIGMPWRGTRASLKGNDPEGSYLANLINRGFVIALKRAHRVSGRGKGRSCDLYMIPLTIKRGDESTWPPNPSTA